MNLSPHDKAGPLRSAASSRPNRYDLLAGVGGIGTGIFFLLEGDHTLGRNESRQGRLLPVRDYCKLHIVSHYVGVLLNARAGGFRVVPIGKVGGDEHAGKLIDEMRQAGIDVRFVETVADRPTLMSVCFQYPDGSGGNVTTSESAASLLTPGDVDRAAPLLAEAEGRCIALAAPEVPLAARNRLLELAGRHGGLRVAAVTSAEAGQARRLGLFGQVDLLSVNQDEAAAILGRPAGPGPIETMLDDLAAELVSAQPGMRIILSAGAGGAFGYAGGLWDFCPAARVNVASTAGAGDALLAGAIAGLAGDLPLIEPGPKRRSLADRPLASALDLGVLLAGFSVTSSHTIHPDADGRTLVEFAAGLGVALTGPMRQLLER